MDDRLWTMNATCTVEPSLACQLLETDSEKPGLKTK